MLCKDIIRLAEIGVDELQIESLKVLPGTQMRLAAKEKGLRYSPLPPYEILQTPEMSPADLKAAMKISRMIDFYYNTDAWQNVIRDLICSSEGFLTEFTAHLDHIMVLDTPLSLERRGVILYDYCRSHHQSKLTDISVAWIEAGCSLKKEPAGDITRIKYLEAFLEENNYGMDVRYGIAESSHRYFLLNASDGRYIFGYDSQTHRPSPVFMATLSN